ncbi:MAG: type II secretion system minor pseudopilin GspH [Pseudomonadota bacterium]
MPTSGTGISVSNIRSAAGFTLIEILVVVLIIGVMVAGAVLSLRVTGDDRELDHERDRLLALADYLRDQAALQNREYGIRFYVGGYEFLAYEPRSSLWESLTGDPQMRPRQLPAGIDVKLDVEGRTIVLPSTRTGGAGNDQRVPQIMLFSSGEMSQFELTLRRSGGGAGVQFDPDPQGDSIKATALAAAPT